MTGPDERDMPLEEIADGFALWAEHRPQTIEDWKAVARRFSEEADELRAALEAEQAARAEAAADAESALVGLRATSRTLSSTDVQVTFTDAGWEAAKRVLRGFTVEKERKA